MPAESGDSNSYKSSYALTGPTTKSLPRRREKGALMIDEMVGAIRYRLEPELSAAEFIDVLERSTLAARRPVSDRERIEGMLRRASVIVTARFIDHEDEPADSKQTSPAHDGFKMGQLVGISRAISDFHYATYLSDLAVDVAHQRQGIGRKLIELTHRAAGEKTMLVLLAAPAAREYYPHIGMRSHDSCWIK